MPNVVVMLPNVEESVSRPVIADLTQQVQKLTGLQFVDDVRYTNYAGNIQLRDSSIGDSQERYASFSGKTRIVVEAEEEYDKDGWASSVVERIEHVPLFADPALGVWITPSVVPSNVTLKVRFQTRSRDEARKWRDDIIVRMNQLRYGMQHTLTFNINLPLGVWNLIDEIHQRREKVAGYGEDFMTYIKQHSDKDLTVVSNAAGQEQTLAFRRILGTVNGYFEVSPFPERPSYQEDGGVWECLLEYKITYDRPIACVARYPIMIHQDLLPDKYILSGDPHQNHNDKQKKLSQSQQAFEPFTQYRIANYFCHQDAYAFHPTFDDFVYRIVPKGTATCWRGLIALEKEEAGQVLVDLNELGDDRIDDDILEFLREVEYPYLNKPYQSFFAVNIFREQDLVLNSDIEVNDKLEVINTVPVSLRNSYRIRFAIVVDPTLLPLTAFERMYAYPKVIQKLVQAINDALRYTIDWTNGYERYNHLYNWQFTKLWHLINGLRPLPEASYGTNGSGRSPHTGGSKNGKPGVKNSGKDFGIPDWAYEKVMRTPKMRTVQIQGLIVHRK